MKKLIAFIDDLNQDYIQEIINNDSNTDFLKKIKELVELFYRQKEVVFYDAESLNEFCDFYQGTLNNEYLTSLRDKLDDILQDALDWRANTQIEKDDNYFIWNNQKIQNINNSSLAELTERLSQDNRDKAFALIIPPHSNHPYFSKNFILTFKDKIHEADFIPKFVKIDFAKDKPALEKWIKEYRQPLKMNKNNKHGENGKGAHKSNKGEPVAVLYCSIEKAQELLDSAIGDKREDVKRLFNYDDSQEKFIVFYYEGENPQNQYHGFHLDTENEIVRLIPNQILKELKEKYQLK
jgi:hypothetical protein